MATEVECVIAAPQQVHDTDAYQSGPTARCCRPCHREKVSCQRCKPHDEFTDSTGIEAETGMQQRYSDKASHGTRPLMRPLTSIMA